jgi:DNA-binding NarL/FixJ family response regulator
MKLDSGAKVIEAIRKVRAGQLDVSEKVTIQMFNRMVEGRPDGGESPVAGLSDRQLEVATLIGAGLSTREVATRLRVSVKTVETHRAHLKNKLQLDSASQLVQFCVRWVEESKREAV